MRYLKLWMICLAASPAAWAMDEADQGTDRVHGEEHEHTVLEEVHVTATPLARDALEMTQSASVVSGEALNRQLGNSLGDTLKNMPGVASQLWRQPRAAGDPRHGSHPGRGHGKQRFQQ
jgi:outer membrane receptor protein involved in Fe transport